jgi:hypothetical protein
VIDLKTGRDLQYGWLEIAVQLAIYANSDFIYNKVTKEYEPMPPCDRETAIVAHLPVGEGKLTIYEVDIATGWQIADLCYRVRNARKVSGLAKVLEVVAFPSRWRAETSQRARWSPDPRADDRGADRRRAHAGRPDRDPPRRDDREDVDGAAEPPSAEEARTDQRGHSGLIG